MGLYRTIYPFATKCEKCGRPLEVDVQFKTGYDRSMQWERPGDKVDLLDGLYIGIYKYYCSSCFDGTTYGHVEVLVVDGVIGFGKNLPNGDRASEERILDNTGLFSRNSLTRKASASGDSLSLTYAPLPFASLRTIKIAALFADEILILDNLSHPESFITQSEYTLLSPLVKQYVLGVLKPPLLEGTTWFSSALKYFGDNIAPLVDEGIVKYIEPSVRQLQAWQAWMRESYGKEISYVDYHTSQSIALSNNATYSFFSDLKEVIDSMSNIRASLARNHPLEKTYIRELSGLIGFKALDFGLPDLEFATMQDILEARCLLRDELAHFRARMISFASFIMYGCAPEEAVSDHIDVVIEKQLTPSIIDIERKMRSSNKKLLLNAIGHASKSLLAFGGAITSGSSVLTASLLSAGILSIEGFIERRNHASERDNIIANDLSFLVNARTILG
jgi:hypothetical protein